MIPFPIARAVDRASTAGAWAATWLFIAAGAMLSYEVAARYFFVRPTIWAAELSQLCLIWGSLLAMAWVLRERKHIHIAALVARLPEHAQRGFEVATLAFVGLFSLPLIWFGGQIALDSYSRNRSTGTLLNIPNWWSEVAVPTGFLLLAVQVVVEIARLLRHQARPGLEDGME